MARALADVCFIDSADPAGSRVLVDIGGGYGGQAEVYGCAGVRSGPLPGDWAVCVSSTSSSDLAAVAYYDPDAQALGLGETRVYARDSGRSMVGSATFRSDGTIEVAVTDGPSMTLSSQGVVISGDTQVQGELSITGDVTIQGNLTVTGTVSGLAVEANTPLGTVDLALHTHPTSAPGSPTSVPTPAP